MPSDPSTCPSRERRREQGVRRSLSYRDVEEMLAERGLDISYETVRRWFLKFGSTIAANLRRCPFRLIDPS